MSDFPAQEFIDRVGFVGALSLFRMTPVVQKVDRDLSTAVSSFVSAISAREKDEFEQGLADVEECSNSLGISQVVHTDREFYVHTVAILCGYIAHRSLAERPRMIRAVAGDFWRSVDALLEDGGGVPGLDYDDSLKGIEMRWLDRDWEQFQAASGLSLLFDARIREIAATFDARRRIAARAAEIAGWDE